MSANLSGLKMNVLRSARNRIIKWVLFRIIWMCTIFLPSFAISRVCAKHAGEKRGKFKNRENPSLSNMFSLKKHCFNRYQSADNFT